MSRSLRSRAAGGALLFGLTTAGVGLPAMSAGAAGPAPAIAPAAQLSLGAIPVTGTTADGTFTGSLSNLSASTVNGVLQLTGTLTGTSTNSTTGVTQTINDTFTATIQDLTATGACQILNLDLGPLHLDLLGLVIDLDQVQLDITAVPGAGNLLGNLLCAVAGLLDGSGPLQTVGRLLDRVFAILDV